MKRLILLTLCGGMAFAGTASIITSWPSPATTRIGGLALSGGYLYHAAGALRMVYVTTTTGSRVRSFNVASEVTAVDLTLDITSIWACNLTRYVYRIDPVSGSINDSWRAIEIGVGIAYGSGQIWYASPNRIYRYLVNGSLMGQFGTGGRLLTGLEYADGYLWGVDCGTSQICQFTESGSLVSSLQCPVGICGITRTSGAGPAYIWYTDTITRYVYQITAGYTPIAPVSLGKVKALYR